VFVRCMFMLCGFLLFVFGLFVCVFVLCVCICECVLCLNKCGVRCVYVCMFMYVGYVWFHKVSLCVGVCLCGFCVCVFGVFDWCVRSVCMHVCFGFFVFLLIWFCV